MLGSCEAACSVGRHANAKIAHGQEQIWGSLSPGMRSLACSMPIWARSESSGVLCGMLGSPALLLEQMLVHTEASCIGPVRCTGILSHCRSRSVASATQHSLSRPAVGQLCGLYRFDFSPFCRQDFAARCHLHLSKALLLHTAAHSPRGT